MKDEKNPSIAGDALSRGFLQQRILGWVFTKS
jgi:hypothetical protein